MHLFLLPSVYPPEQLGGIHESDLGCVAVLRHVDILKLLKQWEIDYYLELSKNAQFAEVRRQRSGVIAAPGRRSGSLIEYGT